MPTMTYGKVAGVDMPISRLVQGTTMVHERGDEKEMFAVLDAAFEAGINTFDTAHIYGGGGNERMVGKWIRDRGLRDQVAILAKGAHHNADRRRCTPWDITAEIYDSLVRFKTDYLDLYVLHRDDPTFPTNMIVDCLNEHVKAGRIRAFGGSNWTHLRLQAANTHAKYTNQVPFALASPNFSLAEQYEEPWPECVSISGPANAAARAWYEESQMPVFCWSSLAGGFWSDRYSRENYETVDLPAADLVRRCYCGDSNFERLDRARTLAKEYGVTVPRIATAYVLSQPMDVHALVAPVNPAEVADTVASLDLKLSPQECAWLDLRAESR